MGLRTQVYDCQVAIINHELSNVTDSRIFAGYYFLRCDSQSCFPG